MAKPQYSRDQQNTDGEIHEDGPTDHYAMTLVEVGHQLGLSRSMVFAIQKSALAKARKLCKKRGITSDQFMDVLRATPVPINSGDKLPFIIRG